MGSSRKKKKKSKESRKQKKRRKKEKRRKTASKRNKTSSPDESPYTKKSRSRSSNQGPVSAATREPKEAPGSALHSRQTEGFQYGKALTDRPENQLKYRKKDVYHMKAKGINSFAPGSQIDFEHNTGAKQLVAFQEDPVLIHLKCEIINPAHKDATELAEYVRLKHPIEPAVVKLTEEYLKFAAPTHSHQASLRENACNPNPLLDGTSFIKNVSVTIDNTEMRTG